MHHQDFSADPTGTGSRKSSFHYRRGSSGASASSGAGAPDDNIPTQTGSSSPGLHHHQQQQHQPQSQAAGGAQVKKKSGFQITSVTSAQISGNNSLADDTESYDDMDESHTEDLSSSEMLDVSMSRATDTGVPERSSSDETLNSLHGFDTPGIVSPNEPLHPHSIPQGSQQHASMVNGTVPHHYYPPPPAPQQHSQPHHHHSDSLGGGEPQVPALPVTPLASSSPALTSKAGINQSQMPSMLDKSAGGTIQPPAADLQGGVNISSVSAVPAAPPSGPAAFDTTSGVSGQVASTGGGTATAAAATTQPQQTQTATGSRFRVVKLDTNSEPFRKGRWTCTEYYEKEIPHATMSETLKGAEAAAEAEAGGGGGVGVSPGPAAVQPPHTLQPYPPPSQDFTSPQAMQSPPQGPGPAQATPLSYVSPQEAAGAAHMPQPVAPVALLPAVPQVTPQVTAQVTPQVGVNQPLPVMPQLLPYAGQPQAGYPAPQLLRQPDFIQPTAPFQTQVQPPPPHVTTGISMTTGAGVAAQPPVSITQQLPLQGQAAPPALATFPPQSFPVQPQQHLPQAQAHPPSTAPAPPTQGVPYMPLTALQADLQPLLTPGATLTHSAGGSSLKSSHLEGAQKLLFQHQGLLGLPRLGGSASREGAAEAGITAGSLAHMGMSAEASAFMAAAAAGLRTQHADGDEDSSSGTSVVAIDNKIEQAMDLVKSHLMYAVREEVEVLKEQIKELIERNSQLEQENNLLKTLASPEQMAQFQAQVQTGGSPTGAAQPPVPGSVGTTQQALPPAQNSGMSA